MQYRQGWLLHASHSSLRRPAKAPYSPRYIRRARPSLMQQKNLAGMPTSVKKKKGGVCFPRDGPPRMRWWAPNVRPLILSLLAATPSVTRTFRALTNHLESTFSVAIRSDRSRDRSSSLICYTFLIARSPRDSTRESYKAGLAGYFSWGSKNGVDPRSGPLTKKVVFLIHLFDRNLALSINIRPYRSAMAVIHKGFDDGTIVSNAPTLI